MATEIKPIRNAADYEAALAEVERLWGAKPGTPRGDRTTASSHLGRHFRQLPDRVEVARGAVLRGRDS